MEIVTYIFLVVPPVRGIIKPRILGEIARWAVLVGVLLDLLFDT